MIWTGIYLYSSLLALPLIREDPHHGHILRTLGLETVVGIPSPQCHFKTVTLYNFHEKTHLDEIHTICYFSLLFSSMELLATSSNLSKVWLLTQPFSLLATTAMNMFLPSSAITNLRKNPVGTFHSLSYITKMQHRHNNLLIPILMNLPFPSYCWASLSFFISVHFVSQSIFCFVLPHFCPASMKLSFIHWLLSSCISYFLLFPSTHISWVFFSFA